MASTRRLGSAVVRDSGRRLAFAQKYPANHNLEVSHLWAALNFPWLWIEVFGIADSNGAVRHGVRQYCTAQFVRSYIVLVSSLSNRSPKRFVATMIADKTEIDSAV